jgi:hypothetical protein
MSVFEKFKAEAWPFRFEASLLVHHIHGGIPSDPKVAEGWLRSKLAAKDDLIRQMVAETMVDRNIDAEEAAAVVDERKHLCGFKRDENGLYIEGRQVKAAIKEAANVAGAAGKLKTGKMWGATKKGLLSFVAEHIMVEEDRIHLGVAIADDIDQGFVHSTGPGGRRTGIRYNEFVEEAKLTFHVLSDHEFEEREWAMIWLTGEQQGLGANRSMGCGRYEITGWERLK